MKTTLTLLAAILLFASCKKEPTPQPSNPVTPPTPAAIGSNYIVFNADGYSNDTFYINNWQYGYWVDSSGVTQVTALDSISGASLFFSIPVSAPDTFNVTAYQSSVSSGTKNYGLAQMWGRVTRYDGIGGVIEGRISGTGTNTLTGQPQNFTGVFSVRHIQ